MEFPPLHKYDKFAYDTETTGLQYKIDTVFGFSIALPDGRDFYYDIRRTPQAVDWINSELRDWSGDLVCHNASFDYRMSNHTGIYLPIDSLHDTAIRATLINEHEWVDRYGNAAYSLDQLAIKYIDMRKHGDIYQDLADIFGGKPTRRQQMKNLHLAPPEVVCTYAKQDPRVTLALYDWQNEEIMRQDIHRIVDFERELMPVIIRTEMRGIRIDEDYTEKAIKNLDPIVSDAQKRLDKIAGKTTNVNSSTQIKALFEPREVADGVWVTKDGEPIETTDKGGPSIGAEVLRGLKHPIASTIVELRSLLKTRDTFLAKHVLGHSIGGYVYPNINQTKGEDGGTGTGRLSYTDPAMQQIPSRNKKVAAVVKPCFLPPPGMIWVDCDKASFEVRVFLDLVGNPDMLAKYKANPRLDGHQFVADLTGLVRNAEYSGQANAKQLNLSMIFNSGNGAIADKMGLPYTNESFLPRNKKDIPSNWVHYRKAGHEAMEIIDHYHSRMPGVKELAERQKRLVEKRGYEETYFGRRIRFPNPRFSYKASGLLIQATAADLNKENWMIIDRQLGDEGHLILNTHDSYGLALPEDWEPLYGKVKQEIEEEGRLDVPLILDWSGAGNNWWEALQGENNVKQRRRKPRSVTG